MPILLHQAIFRPARTPSRDMSFGVRSAGHDKIQPPFRSSSKIISFFQLFWCVRGSGVIEFDGRRHDLKRHQVALYYPNMRHYWYADSQYWEFYWFTMDGSMALFLPAAFGLKAGIYDSASPPIALFQNLLRIVGQPSKKDELSACVLAFTILSRVACSHMEPVDGLVNKAIEHIHKQYISPELNIKTLAALLGVRRAVFSELFNSKTGMAPSVYLERLRIHKALLLVQKTHLSIAAIAAQCGYADANYFSRVIRRATGYSPLQFRQLKQPDTGKHKS